MHGSGISIWFFIGVLLTIYGVLICGYGIYELVTGAPRRCDAVAPARACLVGRHHVRARRFLLLAVQTRPGQVVGVFQYTRSGVRKRMRPAAEAGRKHMV